jgi:hypothetical protein
MKQAKQRAAGFERLSNQLDLIFIPLYAFFLWSLANCATRMP